MRPRVADAGHGRAWRRVLAAWTLTLLAVACGGPSDDARVPDPLANWPDAWTYARRATPDVASSGMVVTTDSVASAVGRDVLQAGGNAVDAAIAVSFALAVVNPEAGNIGGGGFMVARMADGTEVALDYRETAPAAAHRDMYLDQDGNVTDRSVVGHLAAGVPGTVMGLWEAHARFGSRPWAELLEPAIALARGFRVGERFQLSLTDDVVAGLARFPSSAAAFLPDGAPPQPGDTLRQPDLAATLERIRDRGAAGFYEGETADLVVREMERGGGIISREDLASYEAVWREPVAFAYRGYRVLSMPPSSSGGATLAEAAAVYAELTPEPPTWHGVEHVHLLAEAWRRAYVDRNHYLADPAFVDMPLETLTSAAYGAWRATDVDRTAATPSDVVGPGVEAFLAGGTPADAHPGNAGNDEGTHTTHFSIIDADRNAVAVTTTLNSWYGSKVVIDGAGFVLNNEMDDFAAKPGTPNQFGLVQGEANAVEPGKRMLSAMSPSVVTDPGGRLFMVAGTPGGATIITTVFQIINNVVDHGMTVSQAVLAPRVHHQHLPDQIFFEPGGLPNAVVEGLRGLGHTVVERGDLSGDAQVIVVSDAGTLLAQSDRRRGGRAIGY